MNYIKMSPIVGMSGYGGGATALPFSGISVPKWEGNYGVVSGGHDGNSNQDVINRWSIDTTGNASDHGDLVHERNAIASCGGEGRGITAGGHYAVNRDWIDYFSFSTAGNASDFGDLTVARNGLGACCDALRACFLAGNDAGGVSNHIDYITVANTGNATDFGDYDESVEAVSCVNDATRAIGYGGDSGGGARADMFYWTIQTTGNSSSFANLANARKYANGCSNLTKALIAGGHQAMNEMEHITVQSASNGTDFGDLTVGRRGLGSGGSSEGDRACWGGGMNQNNNNHYNTIDYTSFSSPGNAGDFGDLTNTPQWSSGASGD